MRRICEIMVTLDFIFRLVLYSHERVSFNIIFLNVLEGIKQVEWFPYVTCFVASDSDPISLGAISMYESLVILTCYVTLAESLCCVIEQDNIIIV